MRDFFGKRDEPDTPLPELNKALIEDTPRLARMTIWALIGFVLFMFLWMALAQVDEVTRGQGKAVPSSRLQKIQNLEGGIVSELLVHEGEVVEAGQPLLRLDDTRFSSNVGETEADRLSLLASAERLRAQTEDRPIAIPAEVTEKAPGIAANETALYNSRRQQLNQEVSGLQQQLTQRQQELREFQSKQSAQQNSLNLLQQEIRLSEPLIAQGAISQVEVLRLKRSEVETRGELQQATLAIPRAQAAIQEVQQKIEETRSRYQSEALTELNKVNTDLNRVQATGKALEDRVSRTLVTSPVRGIVQQLLVNTVGGVVQPGSDIVQIVPLDDTLLVEVQIRPQDIGFLRPGQEGVVKFTAYDYTIYGGMKAQLESISADTITDEKGNSFYIVRLRTEKNHLGTDDKPLLIIPGMVASVDIITGEKSILSYLLKPILRARGEAFRER
nr:HlyD family type I secretion periplasmic adaptor subunit [Pseudomonas matsuisoli]